MKHHVGASLLACTALFALAVHGCSEIAAYHQYATAAGYAAHDYAP